MNVFDLCGTQSKSFSINQALDSIELVHNDEIGILMLKVDRLTVWLKEFVIQLIVTSLFDLQIHNSTTELEKILNDIFWFTGVFSRFRIDHEALPMLSQEVAELHSIVVDHLIVKEVELLEDVYNVDLILWGEVLLYDSAVFLVELFDVISLIPYFNFWSLNWRWQIFDSFWREESISILSLTALVGAKET